MFTWEDAQVCIKYIGAFVVGNTTASRTIVVASLSFAETLLGLIDSRLVTDISEIREALKASVIAKHEAGAISARASAEQKVAEAAEAANRVTRQKKEEREQLKALALKNKREEVEIKALEQKLESDREREILEAKTKLLEAISRLRSQGGDVFFDNEKLKALLEASAKKLGEGK